MYVLPIPNHALDNVVGFRLGDVDKEGWTIEIVPEDDDFFVPVRQSTPYVASAI